MSEKWTKGPWWVEVGNGEDDEGDIYVCHEGTVCNETTVANFGEPTIEECANAHLICAAPEMYEIITALLEYIDAIPAEVAASLPAMPGASRDWIESVGAKARGES